MPPDSELKLVERNCHNLNESDEKNLKYSQWNRWEASIG